MSPDDYKRDFGRTKNMKNSGLMRSRGTPESGMFMVHLRHWNTLDEGDREYGKSGAEGFCLLNGIDEQQHNGEFSNSEPMVQSKL